MRCVARTDTPPTEYSTQRESAGCEGSHAHAPAAVLPAAANKCAEPACRVSVASSLYGGRLRSLAVGGRLRHGLVGRS